MLYQVCPLSRSQLLLKYSSHLSMQAWQYLETRELTGFWVLFVFDDVLEDVKLVCCTLVRFTKHYSLLSM